MRLGKFDKANFDRGRSRWVELLWLVVSGLLVASWIPGSRHRIALLRLFGANIGTGVVFKPYVRVKFPWRLRIGDYSWIGESVWIDNLAHVTIGSHCCVSQGAYLCTGSPERDKPTFDLITRPIVIADQCWLCAFCRVAPGCCVAEGVVLAMGAVADGDLSPWSVFGGCPAVRIGRSGRHRVL